MGRELSNCLPPRSSALPHCAPETCHCALGHVLTISFYPGEAELIDAGLFEPTFATGNATRWRLAEVFAHRLMKTL
jgi:hypothetical protein